MGKKKKIRPFGEVTADMEHILEEMCDDHDLQHGEVRAQIMNWLKVHRPGNIETYLNGENPIDFYGPKEALPCRK